MKFAVIGVGWWGRNIIKTLLEFEEVSSIYIFDSFHDVYSKITKHEKIKIVSKLEEIIFDPSIEAVCISTPPQSHYELSKKCLINNKHVIVEKPPAYEIEQVIELKDIAFKNKLIYMLDALYLFLDPIRKLKEFVDSGEITNIKYIQLFRLGDELRRTGSGLKRIQETMFNNKTDIIEDVFFHDAGILLYLFGDLKFVSVEKLYIYNPSLCDSARIKLNAGNIPVDVNLSWTLTGRRRGIVVYSKDHIYEYDALVQEKQLSKFNISSMEYKYYDFNNIPPLKSMLFYFINCILIGSPNYLDAAFMEKIMKLWREIKNEK